MKKAGDLLNLFLDKQSKKTAQSYASFFRSWESIAGEDTASHSRILDIQKGTLIVEVDHPAWIQMIQMRYKEILNKVQTSFPELKIGKMHLKLEASSKPVKRKRPETAPTDAEPPEPEEVPPAQGLQDILLRLKKSIDEKEKRGNS